MTKALELTGQTFHRLTVLERSGKANDGRATWVCTCDCGNTIIVRGKDLRSGNTKSCGCYKNEVVKERSLIHGRSRTRLHNIWWGVYQRCCDKNSVSYPGYGAKGITLCEDWKNFVNFLDWSISNGYNDNLSIDRIENHIGYEPNNCRWVDQRTQQRNRSNNRYLTIGGITKKLCEWSEETGLSHATIFSRIKRGIPEDQWLSVNPLTRRDSRKLSGVKYVYWHTNAEKWMAMPVINGKSKYVGLFNTVEEAKAAIDDFT